VTGTAWSKAYEHTWYVQVVRTGDTLGSRGPTPAGGMCTLWPMGARAAILVLGVVVGCSVGNLDLDGLFCPCASGYSCDTATKTCVAGTPANDGGAEGGRREGGSGGHGNEGGGGGSEGSSMTDGSPPSDSGHASDGAAAGGCDAGLACICKSGPCMSEVLLTSVGQVTAMAQDATNLYWVTEGGFLYSASKSGGSITKLGTAPTAGAVGAITAVGTTLYWAAGADDEGTLRSCPTTGCAGAGTLLASDLVSVDGLVALDSSLFLTADEDGLETLPETGGTPSAFGGTDSIAADYVATDGTEIYWSVFSETNGLIQRCLPASCGSPATLVSGIAAPTVIAVDSSNVYFTDGLGLARCPRAGCTSPTVLAPADSPFYAMAVDADNVYWVEIKGAFAVPIGGGSSSALPLPSSVSSGTFAHAIVVDDQAVYWPEVTETETSADNVIVKLMK
jgi:hypothetical protein